MAEHEIIKHTKRVYKISRDSSKTWKEKIGEILMDIGIIVFAVTLSLYLHERAEKKGERHIEEEFLQGLKVDLKSDITELSGDSSMYVIVRSGFRYFLNLGTSPEPDQMVDSTRAYFNTLYNTTDLVPNNSRFEGMKASGKLYVIQDKDLLNDILELYQEQIPILLTATNGFTNFKQNKLATFLENNLPYGKDRPAQLKPLLKNPLLQNYLAKDGSIGSIISRYNTVLVQCRKIISKIDKKYDD